MNAINANATNRMPLHCFMCKHNVANKTAIPDPFKPAIKQDRFEKMQNEFDEIGRELDELTKKCINTKLNLIRIEAGIQRLIAR